MRVERGVAGELVELVAQVVELGDKIAARLVLPPISPTPVDVPSVVPEAVTPSTVRSVVDRFSMRSLPLVIRGADLVLEQRVGVDRADQLVGGPWPRRHRRRKRAGPRRPRQCLPPR